MVRRTTRTTWVLRRMRSLGVDQTTLIAYWKAEGRVHLEFACPVWHSSLTAAQAQDLERAQRMAMAAITRRWEPSHTRQLLDLGLERLRPRRELLCQAHGPVYPHWIPAEEGEDGQDLQGASLPHTSILQLFCALFDKARKQ